MTKLFFILMQKFDPMLGGVEKSTFKIGSYFRGQGWDVTIYSLESSTDFISPDFEIIKSPCEGNYLSKENIEHLKETLKIVSPDVVINQSAYYVNTHLSNTIKDIGSLNFACLRQSLFMFKDNYELQIKKLKNPVLRNLLLTRLGKTFMLKRHHKRQEQILKKIIDTHDSYIMLTASNIRELQYFIGDYKPEKVTIIPNSIPEIHPESLSSKKQQLLHVGRLNIIQKRSDLLIPLWMLIKDRLPEWEFVVVGSGDYYDTLVEEGKGLERFRLEGHQKPDDYYKSAMAFMMPSAYEGFPNTLIEAQSHGCMSFVFNSYDALKDIVDDTNASISNPYDIADMADRIVAYAHDTASHELMAKRSLDNASKYTISRVGDIWKSHIESLR